MYARRSTSPVRSHPVCDVGPPGAGGEGRPGGGELIPSSLPGLAAVAGAMVAFALALPAEAATKTALLVVGSTALGAGDAAIKARLDRFYATTVLDDGAPADTSKDLVVISASASPSLVGARYMAAPGGALVLQPQLFDDMAMTASGAFGTASAQT